MRSRRAQLLMLVTWLLATGSHWDVVQVFAWGKMFVDNARVLPWREAAKQTFSPNARCGICLAAQAAAEERSDLAAVSNPAEGRAPLVFQQSAAVVVRATPDWRLVVAGETRLRDHERAAPPVPPPRPSV